MASQKYASVRTIERVPMTCKPQYVAVWRDRLFIGPAVFGEGTIRDCRNAIAKRIRDERWRGSKFAELWPDKPVHSMKAGDSVAVWIGRNGYHLWARYYIETRTREHKGV